MDDQIRHYSNKLAWEIDAFDLNAARESGDAIVVIDARSPTAYAREHIPGAVNVPHRTMDTSTTAAFDRAALFVTYCDGVGCNASTKGALALATLGFRVKELIGGLDWWKRDGYPTNIGAGGPGCGCD